MYYVKLLLVCDAIVIYIIVHCMFWCEPRKWLYFISSPSLPCVCVCSFPNLQNVPRSTCSMLYLHKILLRTTNGNNLFVSFSWEFWFMFPLTFSFISSNFVFFVFDARSPSVAVSLHRFALLFRFFSDTSTLPRSVCLHFHFFFQQSNL